MLALEQVIVGCYDGVGEWDRDSMIVVAARRMVDAILILCSVQEDRRVRMVIAACQRGLSVSEFKRDRRRSKESSTDLVLLCRQTAHGGMTESLLDVSAVRTVN